jgi:exonuclease SbcC
MIERDANELDQAAAMYKEREVLGDRVEVLSRINSDLTDSRFVRFLLDEERSRLAELGSEHFQQLSAGRYRFADDQFAIVDLTAADATRRADSLSGGETFLASLGLALALAEMVAGTGGRLDAFFLDEGFGTLDPEHLDLAMEGIEQLIAGDSDRLVVVVSHVPELRMRLEDLIELERSPVTGDTKVIRR